MIQYGLTARNARLDCLDAVIGTGGLLRIWSGPIPASCAAADVGQKLAEFTLSSPFAQPSVNGVQSPQLPSQVPALTNGLASYWRVCTAVGATVIQGSCGVANADLILSTLSLQANVPVVVTSWAFTEGGA